MTRPPGRLPRLGRAAAGLGAMAIVLAGPPYALVRFTGWPVPRHLPTWPQLQAFLVSPLSDDTIIKGLACAVWVLWAMAAVAVLIEAAAAVAGHSAPRLPVIAPFQAVAAALIGATVLTSLQVVQAAPRSTQPLQAALTASTTVAGPLMPGRPAAAAAPAPAGRPPHAGASRDAPATRPRVYRVVPGDDLWAIAARFLGNGEHWHELFRLNAGKPQPDGRTLTDPSLIYPGWVLLLPSQDGHQGPAARPGHHRPRRPAPARTPAPAPSRTHQGEGSRGAPSPAATGAHPHPRPVAVHLPSGALIGISVALMVAAALTLASIQRRRRYRPRASMTGSLQPGEPPLPAVITALRRAARPAPRTPRQKTPPRTPAPRPPPIPTSTRTATPVPDQTSPAKASPAAAPLPNRNPPARQGRAPPQQAPPRRPRGHPARSRSASAERAKLPSTSPPSAGSA